MKKYVSILFLLFFLTGCATGNKFGEETCKDLHGQFTKAVKCLELKFVSLNPKKNEDYKDTYELILKALANQVYENRIDNILFLLGLIIGPIIYSLTGNEIVSILTNSIPLLIIGGLLVGVGTKIGNGCTSGHGICGIGRFSLRSIIATITFIITGVVSVFILQQFGINI